MTAEARALFKARKTAKLYDSFSARICFPCNRALNPDADDSENTPAEYLWVGSAPAFLPVLLCQRHYQTWIVAAVTEGDAHLWPTLHIPLPRQGS